MKFIEDYEKGLIDNKKVDESFERINNLAKTIEENKVNRKVLSKQKVKEICIDIVAQSSILLKNQNNALPLIEGSVLILGDANFAPYYHGGGSAEVQTSVPFKKLSDLLKEERPELEVKNYDLFYKFDCLNSYGTERIFGFAEAKKIASEVDNVIMIVGNCKVEETEGSDRKSIKLSPFIEDLINRVAKVNKNLIIVIEAGSVIDCSSWINNVKAVLNVGFGGTYVNDALAKVLTGKLTPSGRLSETYPMKLEDCYCKALLEDIENDNYDDDIFVGYRYFQNKNIKVRFPFGYGLSYGKFRYSNFILKKINTYKYELEMNVTNTSKVDDYEVVELFVKNPNDGKVIRPVKEFRRFKKVFIKANKTKKVMFEIDKDCFEYFNESKDCFDVNNGTYYLQVSKDANKIIKEIEVNI